MFCIRCCCCWRGRIMRSEYCNLIKQQSHAAAIYCRLSREDGMESESSSIQTQRQLLRRYAKEQGYSVYEEYVDDGYSGTNFDRPNIKRMMDDIQADKINVVLTKDLSRLGRNNALVAYYTEIYFPEHDVRFVAVTDGIDTFRSDNEMMPFKSVVNEFYARDISRKIKAAFKIKAQDGQFTGSLPPYGYKKDPNDKNKLIPDEVTSIVVRRIFELAVEGYNPYKISQTLCKEKVLRPRLYAAYREGKISIEGMVDPYVWHDSSVVRIIKNPAYLGHMVSNRNITKSYKIKKRINVPIAEWIEVKHTHEPLVDEGTFELAQKVIKVKKRENKEGTVQIFSGILKCATCGRGMAYSNPKTYRNRNAFYVCSLSRRRGKEACSLHYIKYNDIYALVLDDIRRNTKRVLASENKFLERVTKMSKDKQNVQMTKMLKDIAKFNKRIVELDLIIKRLYEDNVVGKISDERFMTMTRDYENEQRELKIRMGEGEEQIQQDEEKTENSHRFVELIKKYTDITELTAPMLKELIDHVAIHQTIKSKGKRSQRVDIHYRFIGAI